MSGPGPNASRYFDNASTTPLDPRVLEAMLPYLKEEFGNANSIHSFGSAAQHAVERAREQVAEAFGLEPQQIFFTSGATESNNWVLRSFKTGIVTAVEHSSVREPALRAGFRICDLHPGDLSLVPPGDQFEVQSVMAVNNELGTQWRPSEDIGGIRKHCDATQALGKIDLSGLGVDFMSASSHKVYGPKGVGVLSAAAPIEPLLVGGEHEHGLRAGTLNVPGIVGFGHACSLLKEEREKGFVFADELRQIVLECITPLSDWRVNGQLPGRDFVPHVLSISFLGLEGESLVVEADNAGFAISAGAACSSRSTEPSHVLLAIGLPDEYIRGTVRISFGRFNTLDAAHNLGKVLVKAVERLRTYKN